MVDSIRQSGRIGAITPPGQTRKAKSRPRRDKKSRDPGEDASQEMEEAPQTGEDKPHWRSSTSDDQPAAAPGKNHAIRTGRHIDVRI